MCYIVIVGKAVPQKFFHAEKHLLTKWQNLLTAQVLSFSLIWIITMTDRAWAYNFYISPQWVACRKAYAKSKGLLCERCAAAGLVVPGEEVHHKIKLTPDNINDPSIALNWDNLEVLCKQCHLAEHNTVVMRTDEGGHVDLTEDRRKLT